MQQNLNSSHLDLRPPETLDVNHDRETVAFSASRESSSAETQDLPELGGSTSEHAMSRAEEFAHRVHKEGLPIARLWQTHSALLSLGLNQKGKPGLWLIQKVP
jgi:hypothetical protein